MGRTPGPNDYNWNAAEEQLEPGLGKDEPTDEQMAGLRSRGAAEKARLEGEMAEQSKLLSAAEKRAEKLQIENDRLKLELKAAQKKAATTKPESAAA